MASHGIWLEVSLIRTYDQIRQSNFYEVIIRPATHAMIVPVNFADVSDTSEWSSARVASPGNRPAAQFEDISKQEKGTPEGIMSQNEITCAQQRHEIS